MNKLTISIIINCALLAFIIGYFSGYANPPIREDDEYYEQRFPPLREYQVEIDNDSLYLFDMYREVGSVAWPTNNKLDSMIMKDNE